MLTIVGNGPSRKKYNLDELDEWWGCNLIFEESKPDILFAVDIHIQVEIINNDYYKNNKVYVGEWNPLDKESLDALYFGYSLSNYEGGLHKHIHEGDTHFVTQGNGYRADFLGFNSKYNNNLLTSESLELRNLFSGMSALGYAMMNGYKQITLIGFDALQYGEVGNVFEGCGRLGYLNKYTEESRVLCAQQSQFIALLKHFPDVEVFFKNELDKLERVEYTNLTYYEERDDWILGKGYQHDTMQ
jgi:hypothetical protein